MKKQYLWFALLAFLFVSCEKELDQTPVSTASKAAVFGSKDGLKCIPTHFIQYYGRTTKRCYVGLSCCKTVPTFIHENAFAATLSSGWTE